MSGSTLLVFPLWGIERVLEWRDRLSQIAQLLENGLRKHTCRSGIRREASKSKSRKSLFHFKPEKVNKTFRNKTFSKASAETEKACLYKIICMQSVICACVQISSSKLTLGNKSLPEQKTITEWRRVDNIIQDFKTNPRNIGKPWIYYLHILGP